jgi:hypothetical protein
MNNKIKRAAVVATLLAFGTTTAAASGINLTRGYTRVTVFVAGDSFDIKTAASAWCKAKGHGGAVDTDFLGVRNYPGPPAGFKATYRRINCLLVPLKT